MVWTDFQNGLFRPSLVLGMLVLLSQIAYGFWSFVIFGWEAHGWAIGVGAIITSALLFQFLIDQTSKGIAFHTRQLEAIETIMQAKF